MPQTLFDKIWQSHLVARRADGRDLIYIDRHIMHDLHAPHALEQLDKQQRPVRRPDLTFATQDHTPASKPGRDDTTNPEGTPFLRATRAGAARHNIRLFDLGDPEQGISHVVAPELGMVLPGATHAVPDSHACTVGGLGVLAFGTGASELEHVLATQVLALKRPKRMRVTRRRPARAAGRPPRTSRCASSPRSAPPAGAAIRSSSPAARCAASTSRAGSPCAT